MGVNGDVRDLVAKRAGGSASFFMLARGSVDVCRRTRQGRKGVDRVGVNLMNFRQTRPAARASDVPTSVT